jgi:hypothetical protein
MNTLGPPQGARREAAEEAAPAVLASFSDGDLELDLWAAAAADDVSAVIERLKEPDAFVDLRSSSGATALHACCSFGSLATARYLLEEAGADVHARDGESGWTPLHRAFYHGHTELALLLLQFGAALEGRDRGRPWCQEQAAPGPPPSSSPASTQPPLSRQRASTSGSAGGGGDHDGLSPLSLLSMSLREGLRVAKKRGGGGEVASWGDGSADFQVWNSTEHREDNSEIQFAHPWSATLHHSLIASLISPSPCPVRQLGYPAPRVGGGSGAGPRPRRLLGLAHCEVVGVACGRFHSLAVTRGGQVLSWGHGRSG